MPQIIKTTVYTIDELSEKAKAKAREGYIVDVLNNVVQWYEADFHDFENICKILGITLDPEPTRPKQPAGTSGASPCIWFTGFSSQGDGACFEGRWKHIPETCRGIRDYAPLDERLHEIAETLAAAQKQNGDELYATMTHHGMYYHERCMRIDIQRDSNDDSEPTDGSEETVSEALRDLARWLYRKLETTYEHETSDSVADEAILANDWMFTANGTFFTNLHSVTR